MAGLAALAVWVAMAVTALPAAAATYPFSGFRAPIVNPPSFNTPIAGATVTLRFGLGGDRGSTCSKAFRPSMDRLLVQDDDRDAPTAEATGSLTYEPVKTRLRIHVDHREGMGRHLPALRAAAHRRDEPPRAVPVRDAGG